MQRVLYQTKFLYVFPVKGTMFLQQFYQWKQPFYQSKIESMHIPRADWEASSSDLKANPQETVSRKFILGKKTCMCQ